jgi:RNA recognition motif-containing protein
MKLYVGNIPFSTTDDDLKDAFYDWGYPCVDAKIIFDRETDRSRGFGFVTLGDGVNGAEAIDQLDGREYGGRKLVVNEARDREGSRGGGGGDRRGGHNGGGGGGGGDRDRGRDDRQNRGRGGR